MFFSSLVCFFVSFRLQISNALQSLVIFIFIEFALPAIHMHDIFILIEPLRVILKSKPFISAPTLTFAYNSDYLYFAVCTYSRSYIPLVAFYSFGATTVFIYSTNNTRSNRSSQAYSKQTNNLDRIQMFFCCCLNQFVRFEWMKNAGKATSTKNDVFC